MKIDPKLIQVILYISSKGGRALIVGGAVRDHLLGLEPKDLDIEVYGLMPEVLKETLASYGKVDEVGVSFGIFKTRVNGMEYDFSLPRREKKDGSGHCGFSVEVDPHMLPYNASKRRDFTINSISYDCLTETLYDPHCGEADLKRKLLVPTSEAFSEDPLRILRGMQFASRFDLEVSSGLISAGYSMFEEYYSLAKERIWVEWEKWAKGPYPEKGLDLLSRTHWLKHFKHLNRLPETPQDPIWHPEGNVWQHTKHVCRAMADICGEQKITGEDRTILMFAALCHDIGKGISTFKNDDGRWVAPGHAFSGVELTINFLNSIGCKQSIIEMVAPLVQEHMVHIGGDISPRMVRRLASRIAPSNIDMLALVVEADMNGRPPTEGGLPKEFKEILEVAEEEKVKASKPIPIVMGRHLIEKGLTPNPRFGKILQAAYDAQLDGEFSTLEDGIAFSLQFNQNLDNVLTK